VSLATAAFTPARYSGDLSAETSPPTTMLALLRALCSRRWRSRPRDRALSSASTSPAPWRPWSFSQALAMRALPGPATARGHPPSTVARPRRIGPQARPRANPARSRARASHLAAVFFISASPRVTPGDRDRDGMNEPRRP
jgi:hypothetical protein